MDKVRAKTKTVFTKEFGAKTGTIPNLKTAVEHVIDVERRLVLVKFGKTLTVADIARYAEFLRCNPSFDSTYSEIVDLTRVEELRLGANDFLRLADEIDPFASQSKRAFVVRNSSQEHAARMHRALHSQRSLEIFHSLAEAEAWVAI